MTEYSLTSAINIGSITNSYQAFMNDLKYLSGYADELTVKVHKLIQENRLGGFLLSRYPAAHSIRTDKSLYDFTIGIKNKYLRNSPPLNKVSYDSKITAVEQVLGMHYYISKVQGPKLRSKHEIKIASVFRQAPLEFLRMIVVHELAHLKEKDHSRAFYKLCEYMEPEYYQLEFDVRLYLTYIENAEPLYR